MDDPDARPSDGPDFDQPFHQLRVAKVERETADTISLILSVPDLLKPEFAYRAGQYLAIRARVGGKRLTRCYSMSSSPETDKRMRVTVKRVEGGAVSNWIHDVLKPGDAVEAMVPAGRFCLRPHDNPIVLLGGGSGITPLLSLAKSALATTQRRVTLVDANRDRESIVFAAELDALAAADPGRFRLVHWLDDANGLITSDALAELEVLDPVADVYICGPDAFMKTAEQAVLAAGVDPGHVFFEHFVSPLDAEGTSDPGDDFFALGRRCESVTITLRKQMVEGAYRHGDTILDAAMRLGLRPPFVCRAGECASCIARVTQGAAAMFANHALALDEVEGGYILTCQSVPTSRTITLAYED